MQRLRVAQPSPSPEEGLYTFQGGLYQELVGSLRDAGLEQGPVIVDTAYRVSRTVVQESEDRTVAQLRSFQETLLSRLEGLDSSMQSLKEGLDSTNKTMHEGQQALDGKLNLLMLAFLLLLVVVFPNSPWGPISSPSC